MLTGGRGERDEQGVGAPRGGACHRHVERREEEGVTRQFQDSHLPVLADAADGQPVLLKQLVTI